MNTRTVRRACACGRRLYGHSIRRGLKHCGYCTQKAKLPAKYAQRAKHVELGRFIGEQVFHRLTQETAHV